MIFSLLQTPAFSQSSLLVLPEMEHTPTSLHAFCVLAAVMEHDPRAKHASLVVAVVTLALQRPAPTSHCVLVLPEQVAPTTAAAVSVAAAE
jgi:hypothetical protein